MFAVSYSSVVVAGEIKLTDVYIDEPVAAHSLILRVGTYRWLILVNLLIIRNFFSIQGISIAILEVFTISTFVFLVLSYLPPNISILILSGVFFVQICIDIKRAPWKPAPASRHQYHNLEMEAPVKPSQLSLWLATLKEWFRQLLENRTVKIVALVLQAVGILVLTIFLGVKKRDIDRGGSVAVSKILRPVIALPIALLIISFIWSDKVQKLIAHTNHIVGECRTARYKSSKLLCLYRVARPFSPDVTSCSLTFVGYIVQVFT